LLSNTDLTQDRLRRQDVEGGQSPGQIVGGTEAGQTGDGERLGRAGQSAHLLADFEVVLLRCRGP
jgi:hypothetical protein